LVLGCDLLDLKETAFSAATLSEYNTATNPEDSTRNQKQRFLQFIEFKNAECNFGHETSVFIDRDQSGKNTKRPELGSI
jgi:hypothetical protein